CARGRDLWGFYPLDSW
nr:immunoglobulin heavy chain junction region [Macaca mulatta]MOW46310.1 immunoglobulin heavy chain junction region [Macaca mulatta]MOW46645.1 immunoglobulin heavy chain junction region [Macaca mulatta]MOW46692.1 immunoglobulin heavy chain junction region [Macaca mulatta]MOW46996.1 immunoglobulin heavy chain junction region [Macaca mulatta]